MQMEAHQSEHVKATEGVLIDLVAKHDTETLKLLKEAATQEKGELWYGGTYPLSMLYQLLECP